MSYNELVERLTHRLRIDPELQMDIANELRTHLEDAAQQFLAAGYSEQESIDNAVKALGDPDELAERLWQANRRRIRIRQVIKWAARVALVPAAIVVTFLLAIQVFTFMMLSSGLSDDPFSWHQGPDLSGLTEEQRFIFTGDPNLPADGIPSVLEQLMDYPRLYYLNAPRAKSIADRWPDNPVYYGNYIAYLLADERIRTGLKDSDPDIINEVLTELDRGERLEPQNAVYNVLKAAILIDSATEITEDNDRTYPITWPNGKTAQRRCYQINITDRDTFNRALTEFERALTKQYCTLHTIDMAQHRLDLLPAPTNINEYIRRQFLAIVTLLPEMEYERTLVRAVCAYAIQLAQAKQTDHAVELIRQAELLASKTGTHALCAIEILCAFRLHEEVLGHAGYAFDELGLANQATKTRKKLTDENDFYRSLYAQYDRDAVAQALDEQGGMLIHMLYPAIPGYRPNLTRLAAAEYAQITRGALAELLGTFVVALVLVELIVGVMLWRHRHHTNDRPKLLFVGWRRLVRILLLAIVVPALVYVAYLQLPFASRQYGPFYAFDLTVFEFEITGAAMIALLFGLSGAAIRQRADEAGIAVPAPRRFRDRRVCIALHVVLVCAIVATVAAWHRGVLRLDLDISGRFPGELFGYLTVLVLPGIIYLFIWLVYEARRLLRLGDQFAHFRRTLIRSLAPILAAAVIMTGLLGGWGVRRLEASAMQGVSDCFVNEVDKSDFRHLRERCVRVHQTLLTEYLAANPASQPTK